MDYLAESQAAALKPDTSGIRVPIGELSSPIHAKGKPTF
jgi:hypothetical protein